MYRSLHHFKHFRISNRYIIRFAILSLLYAIANGMVCFILPVILEERIHNLTVVGLILAFSSVWNIVTDLVIGLLKKPPTYRFHMQLTGFLILAFFAGIWLSHSIWMLVLAAAIWGIFTELQSFANFDFVLNASEEKDRGLNFGLMSNFRSLGYTIAPLIAGAVIIISQDLAMVYGVFFAMCILILFNLQLRFKRLPKAETIVKRRMHTLTQIKLWVRVGKKVLPFLAVTLVQGMADGVLTSFMPKWVESTPSLKLYGGFILAASTVPTMLISGYFGHLADKYGRKNFILLGLLVSGVSVTFLGFSSTALVACAISLLVGVGYSLYVPALSAQQSEYVEKHHNQENEVIGESGMSYNLGFIFGAGATGFLVTVLHGYGMAFAVLGFLYLAMMIFYWVFGARNISFKERIIGQMLISPVYRKLSALFAWQ